MKVDRGFTAVMANASQKRLQRARGSARSRSAFTFAELLVVLAVLGLLAALAMPTLASTRLRSQRIGCVGNLSQIGRAFNMWATDHGNRYPFELDYSQGGTGNHPTGLQNNEWFQFYWISNELATPRVLDCPADPIQETAMNWTPEAAGGFLSYQDNAISYLLAHPFTEDGRQMLCADRSLRPSSLSGGGCPYLGVGVAYLLPSATGWTDGIHQASGNVLFNDGGVDELDDTGVRRALSNYQPPDVQGAIHAKFPGLAPAQ